MTCHTSLHFIRNSMSFTMSAWARKIIVKGPKPPCKPCGGQAKKTVDLDKDKAPADSNDSIVCITWDLPCMEHLVQWLEDNVEDHQRLFSDLAQDAKDEKCHTHVAKSGKVSWSSPHFSFSTPSPSLSHYAIPTSHPASTCTANTSSTPVPCQHPLAALTTAYGYMPTQSTSSHPRSLHAPVRCP